MKTDYKVEGDQLVFQLSEDKKVDSDNDGEASVSIEASIKVVADGSEILEELLKSNSLAQKAKDYLIKLGLVKA